MAELLAAKKRRRDTNRIKAFFPLAGPLRRELYPKHLRFFDLGLTVQERCFMAANRVGKTWGAGGYETTLHLTGEYPDWWTGHRFDRPIDAWVAGDTSQTTRDIVQHALLGVGNVDEAGQLGTGLIPLDKIIGDPTASRGITGSFDGAAVRHKSGGVSSLGFKSYDQGRAKFQGTAKHVIWLDEEPPMDVYTECLMRLMTTDGLMMVTFTPLKGMSAVAMMFTQEPKHEPGARSGDLG